MNYELLDELKVAGFPLRATSAQYANGEPIESIAIPTLEELIEACGEPFDGLWLPPEDQAGKQYWIASLKWDWRKLAPDGKAQGATPAEAVARLWLALKTKPTINEKEIHPNPSSSNIH